MNRPLAARCCRGTLIGAAILTVCAGAGNPPAAPAGSPALSGSARTAAPAIGRFDVRAAQAMISDYRAENGLGPVVIDAKLMRMAGEQARAMAARDELDHNIPRPFAQRIQSSGFDAGVAVENIAAGYRTLAEAFAGWRKSPEHRANMLNRSVTRMGIAAADAPHSRYKVFWSLVLAQPDQEQRRRRPMEIAVPVERRRPAEAAVRTSCGHGAPAWIARLLCSLR